MKHVNWAFSDAWRALRSRWWAAVLAGWLLGMAPGAEAALVKVAKASAELAPEGLPAQTLDLRLPHRWDALFAGRPGRATYRFTVAPQSGVAQWGLYFPRVGNQVEIEVNGSLVKQLGQLGDPAQDAAKGPVLIDLPTSVAPGAGGLAVVVRISVQPSRWGGLAAPFAGPVAELRPLYDSRYAWRQYGALGVSIAMGLMAMVAMGLWVMQREPVYGVFALAAALGALRFSDRLITTPPLPWPVWGAVTAVALAAHVVLMAWFALLIADEDRPWLSPFFKTLLALLSGMAVWAFLRHQPMVWTAALALLALPCLVAVGLVARAAWTRRRREAISVTVAGLIVVTAGFRDFLMVRVSGDGPGTFSILPHASMLFVLLLGWVVVDRYARHARDHFNLLLALESKVRERETELELTNQKLREEHARKATLQERQRIMRDIHDGVGAQLVGLLSLLKKDAVPRESLREHADAALDELRMAVDALQPVHDDLATVLATLRFRLQPRLESAGIQVVWAVADLPSLPGLTPPVVLQIQRILLEAFTNVMRHAQASVLRVAARFVEGDSPHFSLVVEDNGKGLPPEGPSAQGHGLANMRARAQAIGATLTLGPAPGSGTRIEMRLPIRL